MILAVLSSETPDTAEAALVRAPAGGATAADFAECRRWIAHHSKSFYLSSLLLPAEVRRASWAFYAFCRRADDAVDCLEGHHHDPFAASDHVDQHGHHGIDSAKRSGAHAVDASKRSGAHSLGSAEQRGAPFIDGARALQRVFALRQRLRRVYSDGTGAESIDRAFAAVALSCGLPQAVPAQLLDGMEADARGQRYATWDELLRYCYLVASTVGLMMTTAMVPGARSLPLAHREELYLRAADLGVAMQLTNIARDVGEDARRGRVYLPDELLLRCGLTRDDVLALAQGGGPPPQPLRRAVAELLAVADAHYRAADRGIALLPRPCRLAVRAARRIYAAIGERVAARDHDALTGRAYVTLGGKLRLVASALWPGRPERALPAPGPSDDLLRGLCREAGLLE